MTQRRQPIDVFLEVAYSDWLGCVPFPSSQVLRKRTHQSTIVNYVFNHSFENPTTKSGSRANFVASIKVTEAK